MDDRQDLLKDNFIINIKVSISKYEIRGLFNFSRTLHHLLKRKIRKLKAGIFFFLFPFEQ